MSFPALLSEGIGPVAALGRSFRLVKGRWWPTFGALVVMNLLVGVISGIITGLLTATLIASTASEATAAVISTIANTLSALVTLPISAAVLTVLYFDLRVRKEGYDLQLLARGVGQDPSAYATSPQAVGEASGLGGGYAPPSQGGGFAPPGAAVAAAASRRRSAPQRRLRAAAGAGHDRAARVERVRPGGRARRSLPAGEPGGSAPPPAPRGGLQSGDPLAAPPERREGEGEAGS